MAELPIKIGVFPIIALVASVAIFVAIVSAFITRRSIIASNTKAEETEESERWNPRGQRIETPPPPSDERPRTRRPASR